MRPGVRELARASGVSPGTVSLWLRGARRVSAEMERRLLEAQRRLEAEAARERRARGIGRAVLAYLEGEAGAAP